HRLPGHRGAKSRGRRRCARRPARPSCAGQRDPGGERRNARGSGSERRFAVARLDNGPRFRIYIRRVSSPEPQPPLLDVFTIDRPEQLKALGHPLRLRVLEMLGQSEEASLTNRELAQRLGVDPGHLHFHVRMLLRAGLIDRADGGQGREKPYRAVARTVRVAPELVSTGLGTDVRASMVDDLQRAWAAFGASGKFRITQTTVRIPQERALRLIEEIAERVRDEETDDDDDPLVVTAFVH